MLPRIDKKIKTSCIVGAFLNGAGFALLQASGAGAKSFRRKVKFNLDVDARTLFPGARGPRPRLLLACAQTTGIVRSRWAMETDLAEGFGKLALLELTVPVDFLKTVG